MNLRHLTLAACLAAGAAGLAACGDSPNVAAQAPAPAANPDQVVAEVGGRKVTLKELDAKWEEFDSAERARVTVGRCLPYGSGITYWPLIELIRPIAVVTLGRSLAILYDNAQNIYCVSAPVWQRSAWTSWAGRKGPGALS